MSKVVSSYKRISGRQRDAILAQAESHGWNANLKKDRACAINFAEEKFGILISSKVIRHILANSGSGVANNPPPQCVKHSVRFVGNAA